MKRPIEQDYKRESDYIWNLNRYIEILERRIKLIDIKPYKNYNLCSCIDPCSSKRREYYCMAKRNCLHKITI